MRDLPVFHTSRALLISVLKTLAKTRNLLFFLFWFFFSMDTPPVPLCRVEGLKLFISIPNPGRDEEPHTINEVEMGDVEGEGKEAVCPG
jgi:hypothetical protein